ncbi:MAG: GcrA cell cycle regulator [Rhizobiales bacterium]|nr:GcrA cell cycle regulator [Hoeflea sp.]MBG18634.1 GcrA cell cycle regulator [Hyphomicrobiales bacterium]|tara:strand:+ start:22726 stop:23259 length:534 start_codon:yes stop_codon:yes gene_type:complete
MNWTDERVEMLKKLWADGLSASQIAAQLGGVSRNAVIGKVHRLNLPGRAKSSGQTKVRTKRPAPNAPRSSTFTARAASHSHTTRSISRSSAATALKADVEAVAYQEIDTRPQEDVVVPISRKLELVQLTERTCKWPIGDPLQEDFHFCGNDSGEANPYCSYHSRLAFQPSQDRRRKG